MTVYDFSNKVAVVTGAAAGLGFGITQRLLEYGAGSVWMLDFNGFRLAGAAEELASRYSGKVFFMKVDISRSGEIEKAIDEIVKASGRIDILFNNAGRPMTRPVLKISYEEIRELIDLNLTGVMTGTRKALEFMDRQGSGYIVNAGSIGGLVPFPYQCLYAGTKAGVIAFTRCLAYEYDGTDIHFSFYAPCNVATSIFSAEWAAELRKEGLNEEEIAAKVAAVKPPANAIPLDEALDILFAGLREYRVDIPVGQDADLADELFCTNRMEFDRLAREIGSKRREYYAKIDELEANGEPIDGIPFPG